MNERDLSVLLHCSDGWRALLGNRGLARRVLRAQQHRVSEIFPGVLATDPAQLKVTEFLSEKLSAPEFQPATNSEGLSENFLTGGSSQLLSISVHKKLPMGIGIEDNGPIRAKLKLPDPDARWREIGLSLGQLLYSTWVDAPARFRKQANSSHPDYETGPEIKMRELARAVKVYCSDSSLDVRLLARLGVFFNYLVVNRFQADPAGKVRYSNTGFDYVEVDASTPYPGHHGMRVRTAYAPPGTSSYICTVAITGYRAYYLNHYAFTYKHREPEFQSEKINRFRHAEGIDVTQYDQCISERHLEIFCEAVENMGYGARFQRWLRLGLGAPSISACPFQIGKEAPWRAVGDPLDDTTYRMTHGLPSGHPMNPDIGKFCMSVELLYRYDQYLQTKNRSLGEGPSLSHAIDRVLLGHNPEFGFLNSADDNLLLSDSRDVISGIISATGTFELDREQVPLFLGVIYGGSTGKIVGHPNLMSYLTKWLVPEESLGFKAGDSRSFFQTAWIERSRFYSTHPRYNEFNQMLNEACEKYHKCSVSSLFLRREQPALPATYLSYADQQFLMDPDVIHYRLDADQVSESLMSQHSSYVPPVVCNQIRSLLLQRGKRP